MTAAVLDFSSSSLANLPVLTRQSARHNPLPETAVQLQPVLSHILGAYGGYYGRSQYIAYQPGWTDGKIIFGARCISQEFSNIWSNMEWVHISLCGRAARVRQKGLLE
jgi:hypothetical protein